MTDIKYTRMLLEAGADVNLCGTLCDGSDTLLIHAADRVNAEGVNILIQTGADVNKNNMCFETALILV